MNNFELPMGPEHWLAFGIPGEAHNLSSRSIIANPNYARSWLWHGLAEAQMGHSKIARGDYDYALKLDPTLYEAVALIALQDAHKNHPTLAQQGAHRLIQHRQDLLPIAAQIGLLLAHQQHTLEAFDIIDAIIASGYAFEDLLRVHVKLLGKLGYTEAAWESLRRIACKSHR